MQVGDQVKVLPPTGEHDPWTGLILQVWEIEEGEDAVLLVTPEEEAGNIAVWINKHRCEPVTGAPDAY